MTVNYTTNLALGQPVTGTESGTWGDDVNNSVTSYLDIAIAGGLSVTITTADVTLVLTQGTSSATNIGSTTAQYAILNVSGAMTAARNLILPSSSRQYVINNNTTGGFALTVKGSATSGVTMVNGEKAHVFWNGSDYAKLSNAPGGTGSFTDLAVSGNLTFTGTGNRITGDFSNATIANRAIFQTSTVNGSTTITVIPNGTGLSSQLGLYGSSDPANAAWLQIAGNANSGTEHRIAGTLTGTGTYLPMTFYTGGSERMRLDTSGVVGINNSSPSTWATRLTVQGTAAILGNASLTGSNPTYQGSFRLIENPTTIASTGGIEFLTSTFGSGYGWKMASIDSSGVHLTFATRQNSATWSEAMRLDSSGNLLLGTSSGTARLVVNGGTSTSQIRWEVNVAAYTSAISTNAAQSAYVYTINDALFHTWRTSNSEKLRLTSTGLGINLGGSDPGNALEVNGRIYQYNDYATLGNYNAGGANSPISAGISFSTNVTSGQAEADVWNGNDPATYANTGILFTQRLTSTTRRDLVFMHNNGNVGIGTNSPGAKLDVTNNQAALSYLIDTNNTTNGGSSIWRMITRNIANTGTTSVELYKPTGTGFYLNNNDTNASNFTALTVGGSERMRIDSSGNVLVTNPAGLGYGTGSGGTVTQATSKSTAVTLNKPTGKITTTADALASNTTVAFTFNNSLIAATDNVVFTFADGNGYQYLVWAYNMLAGSCTVALRNITAGSLSQALPINFAIIKGATS